jgi:hypothetical protein
MVSGVVSMSETYLDYLYPYSVFTNSISILRT